MVYFECSELFPKSCTAFFEVYMRSSSSKSLRSSDLITAEAGAVAYCNVPYPTCRLKKRCMEQAISDSDEHFQERNSSAFYIGVCVCVCVCVCV